MSEEWQCVLNETSVHFLLAQRLRQRQQLLAVFDALANEVKSVGPFLVSFWPDPFVKKLRIINVEKV